MRRTKTPIIKSMRGIAKGLHKAGEMEQGTLREFDLLWLPQVEPLDIAEIKLIREGAHVSQAVFARLLNTSFSTVEEREISQKKPAGIVLKLLQLVQKRDQEVVA